MPLKSIDFNGGHLRDEDLEHLKGMPLTSVRLEGCRNLSDKALQHLKEMPLTCVDFGTVYILQTKHSLT